MNQRRDNNAHTEVTTLGGGCFWCLEAAFDQVKGIEDVVSGYAGGTVSNPTYKQVCTGETGHAEVVEITFDPTVISYKDLLDVYFTIHDPTTLNRQGADVGTQYRSVIFYHTPEQEKVARAMIPLSPRSSAWRRSIPPRTITRNIMSTTADSHTAGS